MAKRTGVVREFIWYLRERKAYWLVPIIVVLLLFMLVIVLVSSGVAQFLYPIF